ncbi:MAG: bacillithiol biosynthesis deacetylase BshB1 [Cytophagaceae bacterium]
MKLDILVMAAHPDDAELGCSGTIFSHIAKGKKVGIVDFTRGELGTRGNADLRLQEASEASKILGLAVRENLNLRDGYFEVNEETINSLIKVIRTYQPEIVLANAMEDRHPDHGKGAELAYRACFLSGLAKISTECNGVKQEAWRPKQLLHYIQDKHLTPDLIVDVSDFWEQKLEAIKAFKSQFYNPDSDEPDTYISSRNFLEVVEARAMEYGHYIGAKYGEGFTSRKSIGVKNLFDLL